MTTVLSPGILTLIYPASIFGYAILLETRPGKKFWLIIVIYTQILLLAEFVATFNFWKKDTGDSITELPYFELVNIVYQIGFNVSESHDDINWNIFHYFLPKIVILWSAMTFLHNEIIFDFYYKKE